MEVCGGVEVCSRNNSVNPFLLSLSPHSHFAVHSLDTLNDDNVILYLPQLLQVCVCVLCVYT